MYHRSAHRRPSQPRLRQKSLTPLSVPAMNYDDVTYWNARYALAGEKPIDWYLTPEALLPHLSPSVSFTPQSRILLLGCGCSVLPDAILQQCRPASHAPEALPPSSSSSSASTTSNVTQSAASESSAAAAAASAPPISLVDFSTTCIEQQKRRAAAAGLSHELDYRVMDARDLKFDENSFDTIIDKGCFDSVSCAIDSKSNAIDVMNSVYRTLRPGGKFVLISHAAPDARLPLLQRRNYKWARWHHLTVDKEEDGESFQYYIYFMEKAA